jgi:anti-sigma factor RsiW
LSQHLTREQIDRYTTRTGTADEILTIASHLEECPECRDAVAAIVDPGTSERPHRWPSRNAQITARATAAEQPERDMPPRFSILPWVLLAILVIALAVIISAMRH